MGTNFDYNDHIAFISTHTKIGTPYETLIAVRTKVNCWIGFSNVVANFHQCLSLIVTKLWTRDKTKHLCKAIKQKTLMDLVDPSTLHRCIPGSKIATQTWDKIIMKRVSKPTIHYCTLPEYCMSLLAPHEYKHPLWLLILKIGTGA